MTLSRIISEVKQNTGRKLQFLIPLYIRGNGCKYLAWFFIIEPGPWPTKWWIPQNVFANFVGV